MTQLSSCLDGHFEFFLANSFASKYLIYSCILQKVLRSLALIPLTILETISLLYPNT